MIPRNLRELGLVAFTALVIAALLFVGGYAFGTNDVMAAVLVAAFGLGACSAFLFAAQAGRKVDPWALQARLMRISDQPTPDVVQANKYVLTYFALCLEELAETAAAIQAPLRRSHDMYTSFAEKGRGELFADYPAAQVLDAGHWLADAQQWLARSSVALRKGAEAMPDGFCVTMLPHEAKDMADGCTDVQVVSSGLAIAAGVPGGPCYEEVALSNLSKANPATGIIDKDPTGKWIKGDGYIAPSLAAVLESNKGNP